MRELTFGGFLTNYIRTLSSEGTGGIYRLTQEAATTNARLREPLLLYALWNGKKECLQKSALKHGLNEYYGELLESNRDYMEESLQNNRLPAEYQKVWNSYLTQRDSHATDENTKMLIRNKVLSLQKEKHITNYRIYTDLKLNPGNLNAWLKHGVAGKVSLDTAREVLRYVNNCHYAVV